MGEHRTTLKGNVAVVEFVGYFSAADVVSFLHAFRGQVRAHSAVRHLVADVRGVHGVASDIHRPSQQTLAYFKQVGIEQMFIVMPNPILSMIVRTTSFVTGLPTKSVDSVEAAFAQIGRGPGVQRAG